MSAFAHWDWSGAATIVVGRVERIPLSIPAEVFPFAVYFTPFTPPEGPQVRYLPKAISLDNSGILLTTTAAMNTEAESLGSKNAIGSQCLWISGKRRSGLDAATL